MSKNTFSRRTSPYFNFLAGALFLFLSLQAAPSTAKAAEIAGVKFPGMTVVDIRKVFLNGVGLRTATFFRIKVYAAALYLEVQQKDAEKAIMFKGYKRLKLQFLRDVSADKVKGGWSEGFKGNNSAEVLSAIQPRIETLNSKMVDMKEGDTMVFDFLPGKVAVTVGQSKPFDIEGEDFRQALLRIWLGENPPNDALKEGLLGK